MGVENFEAISKKVVKQNKDIEQFSNDTILGVVQMILCEVLELSEATENAFLTDDLTAVISEASDCLYLLVRLFDLLGIDGRAIDMKIERNYQKYFGKESREQAVTDWKESGGDKTFFEKYLDNLADSD